jgi:hypothetical protein
MLIQTNKQANATLVDTFAAAGKIVDGLRLASLGGLIALRTAERAAAIVEQRRLVAKYGSESDQAQTAAARLIQLDLELAGIAAEIIRQESVTPETGPDRFVVYGRVLNAKGQGLTKVTVAAINSKRVAIASTESADLGRFELVVLLKRAGAQTTGQDKGPTAESIDSAQLTFQLHLTHRKAKLSYLFDEVFVAVGGQMAYREITVPESGTLAPEIVVTKRGVKKA